MVAQQVPDRALCTIRFSSCLRGAGLLIVPLPIGAFLLSEALRYSQFAWVAWFSLLPLFAAIRALPPLRAMLAGAFWGASLFCFSIAGPGAPIASTAPAVLLLIIAPAVYAMAGSWAGGGRGLSCLPLALGWVGVELALLPLNLRRGLLAGTQGDNALVQFVGSALGYIFVAFLIALFNSILLRLLGGLHLRVIFTCLLQSHGEGGRPAFSSPGRPRYFTHLTRVSRPRAPPPILPAG